MTDRTRHAKSAGGGTSRPPPELDATLESAESLLTPEAVARLLSCSPKSVYAWAARGVLPRVRLGRLVRFRPSDVNRFIDANLA
ncbi:MAG TPA: helix-turn-helix domain-containing protein [Actinomycetota bacterium]|nr:helix-turn-helix domain-containing protein [Actinomycetota bacterium]